MHGERAEERQVGLEVRDYGDKELVWGGWEECHVVISLIFWWKVVIEGRAKKLGGVQDLAQKWDLYRREQNEDNL